jgi:hypothetical protein
MDPQLKAAWTQALRSGHYKQARGHLFMRTATGPRYCANGVLYDLIATPEERSRHLTQGGVFGPNFGPGYMPLEAYSQTGLSQTQEGLIASLNDCGKTFAEIADIIEQDIDSEPALAAAVNREIERIRGLVLQPTTTLTKHFICSSSAGCTKLQAHGVLSTAGV